MNRFLEKVKEEGGKYSYQNVDLPSFEEAKTYVSEAKNALLARIKDAIRSRLEVAENPLVQHAAVVLNTRVGTTKRRWQRGPRVCRWLFDRAV